MFLRIPPEGPTYMNYSHCTRHFLKILELLGSSPPLFLRDPFLDENCICQKTKRKNQIHSNGLLCTTYYFFLNRIVSFATADFSPGNCNISPHKLKFHISVSMLSSYEQQKNISLLSQ